MGEIRYNKDSNTFMAVCRHPDHADTAECKKVRTANRPGRRVLSNPGQGRPVGLLLAWLKLGELCASADEHKQAIDRVTKETRISARNEFKNLEGAAALLSKEREKDADEDSEPEVIK